MNIVATRMGQAAHHIRNAAKNVNATALVARALHTELSNLLPSDVSSKINRGLTSYETVRDMVRRVNP